MDKWILKIVDGPFEAPEWADYATMDQDGQWCFSECMPTVNTMGMWTAPKGKQLHFAASPFDGLYQDSMQVRPVDLADSPAAAIDIASAAYVRTPLTGGQIGDKLKGKPQSRYDDDRWWQLYCAIVQGFLSHDGENMKEDGISLTNTLYDAVRKEQLKTTP